MDSLAKVLFCSSQICFWKAFDRTSGGIPQVADSSFTSIAKPFFQFQSLLQGEIFLAPPPVFLDDEDARDEPVHAAEH